MGSRVWFVLGVLLVIAISVILSRATADDEAEEIAAADQVEIVIHSPPQKAKLHDKLERMVYDTCTTEESSSDGGCAICLDEYCDGERRATIDACSHRFHAFCIEAWLRKNDSCPLCRHELV